MSSPRLAPVTLDLASLPTAIAESISAVLAAHGFAIVRESDTQCPLDGRRLEALLAELGRNVSQAVLCSDVSEIDECIDCGGSTAVGTPDPHTCAAPSC